jgi:hypothetical protein
VRCANQEAGKCYALPHYTVSEAAVEPAVMGPKLVKTTTAEIAEDRLPTRLDRVRRSAVPRLIIQLSVSPCRQKLCEKNAADLPNSSFILGGNGWSNKPMPSNVSYIGHVYTREHNAFNCSARAVLNVSRDSMAGLARRAVFECA